MTGATLAVTGGTGFVGRTLLRLATAQGYRVRALARSEQAPMEGVDWIRGALGQPDALDELVRDADSVIHVAGVVNALDRAAFEAGNVDGTRAIVDAARRANVSRFVHVSSLSAREPQLSNYGWSKAGAETVVEASGLDSAIVRPPWIFGPGDTDTLDLFAMAQRGFVLLPPGGFISVIEVSDLARLLLALVGTKGVGGCIYEPDDGRAGGWTHPEFAKAIGAAVGRNVATISVPAPLLRLAAKGDRLFRGASAKLTADRVSYFCHPDWVADPARRPPAELWTPQVETRQGLKATADAYRAAGWLKP